MKLAALLLILSSCLVEEKFVPDVPKFDGLYRVKCEGEETEYVVNACRWHNGVLSFNRGSSGTHCTCIFVKGLRWDGTVDNQEVMR